MQVIRARQLPTSALEAAAEFYATMMPGIMGQLAEDLVLLFAPASHDHRGWRLAVIQDLARAAAPFRVNGVVGDDEQSIAATLAWLEQAPAVTGQLLSVQAG